MPIMPNKPPLIILVVATAVGPLAINIFLPSMPALVDEFNTSYSIVQLTLSLYLAGLSVAQLLYGPLSDRYGRRPLMLIGMAIFLVGSLICAMAPTITVLIGGRILQAVGGCAGLVLGRAIVRDIYDRSRAVSMISYITMAMMVVPMLTPMIGGMIDEWLGWRFSFYFVLLFGVVVLLGCILALPETNLAARRLAGRDKRVGFSGLLGVPAFYGYMLQLSFSSAVLFSFLGGGPYVVVKLMGYPPSTFGLYIIIIFIFYMIGNFTAARISTKFGTDRMILIGTAISLIAAWGLVAIHFSSGLTLVTLFGAMALIGLGNGISMPNGVAGAVSIDLTQIGTAAGVCGFTQMAFGAVSTMIVGSLLVNTAFPLIAVLAVGATLSFVVHVLAVRMFDHPSRN